jgi:carbonic anhydrase
MLSRLTLGSLAIAFIALPSVASEQAHHWSYAGDEGSAHWGGTCKTGKAQSPIDIRSAAVKVQPLPSLTFDYRPGPLRIIDNGHTVQVNVDPGSSLTIGNDHYQLVQFHFHKPSEEAINGRHYAMVAHLVHRDRKGSLAVVAVLLKAGSDNPLFDKLWNHVPREKEHEETFHAITVSPGQLLPLNRSYFTYTGSLTTPPCSEGVRWFVLETPSEIGISQVIRFGKFYQANARPVQPMNGRQLLKSK